MQVLSCILWVSVIQRQACGVGEFWRVSAPEKHPGYYSDSAAPNKMVPAVTAIALKGAKSGGSGSASLFKNNNKLLKWDAGNSLKKR